jgi:hypothetical protein
MQHRGGPNQGATAIGIGLVAVTLTALSLSHLAYGIIIVTDGWEAWAMEIGIDLGFVALELSQLAATGDRVRKQISRFTKPAIIGTLTGSAGMKCFCVRGTGGRCLCDGSGAHAWCSYPSVDLRADAGWCSALH